MKQSTYIAIILILILIIIGQWFVDHERNNEMSLGIKESRESDNRHKHNYDSLEALSTINKAKWYKDSSYHAIAYQNLRKENSRLKVRVSETRSVKEVQNAIESIPQVADAFNADDSLSDGLEKENKDLKNQITENYDHYRAELTISEHQKSELKGQLSDKEAIIEDQDKQLKRAKRKEKVLKVLIPVAVVLGVLIAL